MLGQHHSLFLGNNYSSLYNKEWCKTDLDIHTGFQPLIKSESLNKINLDSLIKFKKKFSEHIIIRKIFNENLFSIKGDDFQFTFNPIIHFEKGLERIEKKYISINTRGFILKGSIGSHLSFFSSFVENQAIFPNYLHYI